MQPTDATAREFLRDHPEFLPDVRWLEYEGETQLFLNAEAITAFVEWGVRTGRCAPSARETAKEMVAAINEQFGK